MVEFSLSQAEIVDLFRFRSLNSKTNNLIITDLDDFKIVEEIPEKCEFTYAGDLFYEAVPTESFNIKIDLRTIPIEDIIIYTIEKMSLPPKYKIKFKGVREIFKLQNALQIHRKIGQLILYGIEDLTIEEQMLLNEFFYYVSSFFNVSIFTRENRLKTYFLKNGKVLDRRENFLQISASSMSPVSPSQPNGLKIKDQSLKFAPKSTKN